MFIVG